MTVDFCSLWLSDYLISLSIESHDTPDACQSTARASLLPISRLESLKAAANPLDYSNALLTSHPTFQKARMLHPLQHVNWRYSHLLRNICVFK